MCHYEVCIIDTYLKVCGTCPLLIAAEQGNMAIAKMCRHSPRADLNVANKDDKTALMLAVEKGDTNILSTLLSGDDVEERMDIHKRDVREQNILTSVSIA